MDEKKDPAVATYTPNDSDLESSHDQVGAGPVEGKLSRQLKNRHVAMIRYATAIYAYLPMLIRHSIGGVIGTGSLSVKF